MGQYHSIYNVTKKETFRLGGAKLLEKAFSPSCSAALMVLLCNSNGRGGGDLYVEREYDKKYNPLPLKGEAAEIQAALDQVQGRWAGDKIVIQGDYAEKTDPAYQSDKKLDGMRDITELVMKALEACDEFNAALKEEREFRKRFGRN